MRDFIGRHKKGTAAVATLVVVAAAGAAWALLSLRAPFGGGGSVKDTTTIEITSAVVLGSNNVDSCTAAGSHPDVVVRVDGATPGGFCDVRFTLDHQGPTVLRHQDVEFSTATDEAFFAGQCGTVVDGNVDVRLTVRADAAVGEFTASPEAGIVGADTFDPATCPTL